MDGFSMVGLFLEPTDTSKQPIRTRYLGYVTGYQPITDQHFLIRSVPGLLCSNPPFTFVNGANAKFKKLPSVRLARVVSSALPTEGCTSPPRPGVPDNEGVWERAPKFSNSRLLGAVTYLSPDLAQPAAIGHVTGHQPIRDQYWSRDWLSANQGPVFPDSIGSCSRTPELQNFHNHISKNGYAQT
eukprot:sb/3471389/